MENIKCQTCEKIIVKDHNRRKYCGNCAYKKQLEVKRKYEKKWRTENPDKRKTRWEKYLKEHPDYWKNYNKKRWSKPGAKIKRHEWLKKTRINRRKRVVEYYGGRCECCGIKDFEFLAIDHINGGGVQHRKKLRSQYANIIDYAIRNNFPDTLRILCHNCNSALGFYGKCPHQN